MRRASAFLTAHPDFQGISVKVTGVFTDASNTTHDFTFTSEVDAEMEARFEPPVTLASVLGRERQSEALRLRRSALPRSCPPCSCRSS